MYKITATAETVYQLDSLRLFRMETKKHLDGSLSSTQYFETEEDAKEHLRECARYYNERAADGSDEKLNAMFAEIEGGNLRLNAVCAFIETLNPTN